MVIVPYARLAQLLHEPIYRPPLTSRASLYNGARFTFLSLTVNVGENLPEYCSEVQGLFVVFSVLLLSAVIHL